MAFHDIQLVDSTANEPASHGFLKFRISQKNYLPIETIINNSAAIYFDFNAPIITNETFHQIGENLVTIVTPSKTSEESIDVLPPYLSVIPNPFSETAEFVLDYTSEQGKVTFQLFDTMGKLVRQDFIMNEVPLIFSRDGLPAGVYFFVLRDTNKIVGNGKLIAQ